LTFEVGRFSALSEPRGRSAPSWRTVRALLADGPRRSCSSSVLRVLARRSFRSVAILSFGWTEFRTVRNRGRTVRGCLADSPRAPRGRSVVGGVLLFVLCDLTDSPRRRAGRSVVLARTVRGIRPDGPRGECGRSAPPGRTVRQSL
jgi:hypothetical protein